VTYWTLAHRVGQVARVRYELKPSGIERVYAVKNINPERPGSVLGWLLSLPSGWVRYGYEGDNPPILRTVDEAVRDLVEYDSWEQDTANWP
jgi:hypothetical protein